MSHEDYENSRMLSDNPFYALIMAAMRRADTDNLVKLKAGWPEVWEELQLRYNAPGGYTRSELRALQEKYDLSVVETDLVPKGGLEEEPTKTVLVFEGEEHELK